MRIAELFYSIQGEGILTGVPSVFIRTSGCNLRCAWCDTPYTSWSPEGEEMKLEAILEYVRVHSKGHTVVTGGEPMIAPDIVPLTEGLRRLGEHITIETAGTTYAPVACDLMSISPKLANSTPWDRDARIAAKHEAARIQLDLLQKLIRNFNFQLKFVVADQGDMDEVRHLVTALGAPADRVVLMPEGVTAEVLNERGRWLAEISKQGGFRFSTRLHIALWGNRRGV